MLDSLATHVMIRICVVCLDTDIYRWKIYIAPIYSFYFFGWIFIPLQPTAPHPTLRAYFYKREYLRVCEINKNQLAASHLFPGPSLSTLFKKIWNGLWIAFVPLCHANLSKRNKYHACCVLQSSVKTHIYLLWEFSADSIAVVLLSYQFLKSVRKER